MEPTLLSLSIKVFESKFKFSLSLSLSLCLCLSLCLPLSLSLSLFLTESDYSLSEYFCLFPFIFPTPPCVMIAVAVAKTTREAVREYTMLVLTTTVTMDVAIMSELWQLCRWYTKHIQCPSLLAHAQMLRALCSHHIESCKFVSPACDSLTLLCVPEDIQLDRGKGEGGHCWYCLMI